MKKFLVLYKSSLSAEEQIAKASPEQSKGGMELWMKWMKKAGPAIVDGGAPLSSVKGSNVAGYSILQAESKSEIERLMKDHPHMHAPGASIDVHEFLTIPT